MVMGSTIPENETLPQGLSPAACADLPDNCVDSETQCGAHKDGCCCGGHSDFKDPQSEACSCGHDHACSCHAEGGIADEETEICASGSSRKCLVTGQTAIKAAMIRFALAPGRVIVPDLSEKLPGRGLWVLARRSVLLEAVKKNPFNRAAGTACLVPPDLVSQVESLLARRCLDTLGLAKAAGAIVIGQPQVEEALRKNALACVLLAADAGGDVRKKLARAPLIEAPYGREELGSALGREALVSIGLRPHPLAERLAADLLRLSGVMDEEFASKLELLKSTNGDSERP